MRTLNFCSPVDHLRAWAWAVGVGMGGGQGVGLGSGWFAFALKTPLRTAASLKRAASMSRS